MKTLLLWFVIIVLVFLVWSLFTTTKDTSERITYTTFLERIESGAVERVIIRGTEVVGTTKPAAPGGRYDFRVTIPPNYPYTYDTLRTHGVNIEMEEAADTPLRTALISWAPILFLIALWMYFMRRVKINAARQAETVSPQDRNHSAE